MHIHITKQYSITYRPNHKPLYYLYNPIHSFELVINLLNLMYMIDILDPGDKKLKSMKLNRRRDYPSVLGVMTRLAEIWMGI